MLRYFYRRALTLSFHIKYDVITVVTRLQVLTIELFLNMKNKCTMQENSSYNRLNIATVVMLVSIKLK